MFGYNKEGFGEKWQWLSHVKLERAILLSYNFCNLNFTKILIHIPLFLNVRKGMFSC